MIALRKWLLPLGLAVAMLAACAHGPAGDACASPVPGIRYCLLPPAALPVDPAPRLVHVSGPDVDQHLVSQLGMHNDELVFAANSLLGQPLFEIRYARDASGRARIETLPPSAPVRATWLLSMLQIAIADPSFVAGALSGADFAVDGNRRRILRGDTVLMDVERQPGAVLVTLPDQQMQITITELASPSEP